MYIHKTRQKCKYTPLSNPQNNNNINYLSLSDDTKLQAVNQNKQAYSEFYKTHAQEILKCQHFSVNKLQKYTETRESINNIFNDVAAKSITLSCRKCIFNFKVTF